jgi:hypothetical protein
MKAFPTPAFNISDEARVTAVGGEGGMDLRDYFAAQAIPIAFQMLNKEFNLLEEGAWTWHEQDFRTLSERAYRMADAMMDTRSK